MNSDEDTLFNKFFVRDRDSKVSFTLLSDKLGLDDELGPCLDFYNFQYR